MKNNKIIIAGGTGFIGHSLAEYFGEHNSIVILTRNVSTTDNNNFGNVKYNDAVKNNIRLVQWNGKDAGDWGKEVNGADVVINLTGKSVNCRYTQKNKQEILTAGLMQPLLLVRPYKKPSHRQSFGLTQLLPLFTGMQKTGRRMNMPVR